MLIHAISTGSMSRTGFIKAAEMAAPWLNAIHLREPDWSEAATIRTSAEWSLDTTLLINAKTPGAKQSASGLHLPEPVPFHRKMTGRSVHSPEAAVRAEQEGASYVIAGPFRNPLSKQVTSTLGRKGLEDICQSVKIPVIAVGGIQQGMISEVMDTGAAGIAVISAVFKNDDPTRAAYELREEAKTCST